MSNDKSLHYNSSGVYCRIRRKKCLYFRAKNSQIISQ